jgi:hypothetical protein
MRFGWAVWFSGAAGIGALKSEHALPPPPSHLSSAGSPLGLGIHRHADVPSYAL